MKRITRVLSVFISLMMIIGLLLPMGGVAGAAGVTHNVGNATDFYDELTGFADGDTIQLDDDITYTSTNAIVLDRPTVSTVTIDLNGNELILEVSDTHVLDINNITLNIIDSAAAGGGELTIENTSSAGTANGVVMSGTSQFNNVDEADILIIADTASFSIATGTSRITNATGDIEGGPVTVSGGATVTIVGDIVSSGAGLNVRGADTGVTVNGRIFSAGSGLDISGTDAIAKVTGGITTDEGSGNNAILAADGAAVEVTGTVSITGITDVISAAGDGTSVTVTGAVNGNVRASNDAEIVITGNVAGTVSALSSSDIAITGNVTSTGTGAAVTSDAATVTVTGDIIVNVTSVSGDNTRVNGVWAQDGATVNVTRDVTVRVITVSGNNAVIAGVYAQDDSRVTVNRNIRAAATTVSGTGAIIVGVHLFTASGTTGNSVVTVREYITAQNMQRVILFQTGDEPVTFRSLAQFTSTAERADGTYRLYTGAPGTVEVRVATTSIITGNGIGIPFSQSNGTYTLNMDSDLINRIIAASVNNLVRIDLSNTSATTVSITPDFFRAVYGAGTPTTRTLRIEFESGSITFTSGALGTLAGPDTGNIEISLHVQVVSALPDEAQRNAINDASPRDVYSVTVRRGGTSIETFGGSMTIVLKYSGTYPAEVHHVSRTGQLTLVPHTPNQANRTVSFSRDQLSVFIIRQAPDTTVTPGPAVPQTSDDVNMLMLGIVALAAVSGLVIMIVIKKRFMAGNNK